MQTVRIVISAAGVPMQVGTGHRGTWEAHIPGGGRLWLCAADAGKGWDAMLLVPALILFRHGKLFVQEIISLVMGLHALVCHAAHMYQCNALPFSHRIFGNWGMPRIIEEWCDYLLHNIVDL